MLKEECYQLSAFKKSCVLQKRGTRREETKVTYSSGENDTEIDFVLVGKEKVSTRCESYTWGIAAQAGGG